MDWWSIGCRLIGRRIFVKWCWVVALELAEKSTSQEVDQQHHEGNGKEHRVRRNPDGDAVCRAGVVELALLFLVDLQVEDLAPLLLVEVQVQKLLSHPDLSPTLCQNLLNTRNQLTD